MSEFYAKAVFKMIYHTLRENEGGGELPQDFFDLLVVIVLENTADQQNMEKELILQLATAKSNFEEMVGDDSHGDGQVTIGVLRKNLEDIEHKLLDCRREVLVGYKLMGDLIDAEVFQPQSGIDMTLNIVRSAKNLSVFDQDCILTPSEI